MELHNAHPKEAIFSRFYFNTEKSKDSSRNYREKKNEKKQHFFCNKKNICFLNSSTG